MRTIFGKISVLVLATGLAEVSDCGWLFQHPLTTRP